MKHDEVVRAVGSGCDRGGALAVLAGQSGLDVDDAATASEDDDTLDDEDAAFGATWALAATANPAITIANGIA